jgi:uncharacterized surface protein with fasciclin (FAS1) repeats
MKINTKNHLCLTFVLIMLMTGCVEEFKQVPAPTGSTIAQIANGNTDFNILTAALTKTGLATTLGNNNSGSFTVFAPTDEAFVTYFQSVSIPSATADEIAILGWINSTLSPTTTPSISTLAGILAYHVISSEIPSSKVTGAQSFVTIGGTARLSVSKVGADVVLNANRAGNAAANGAQSLTLDIDASNGVIHSINKVLIPVSVANIWAGTSPATGAAVNYPGFTVNYAVSPPAISVFGTVMPRKPAPDGTINVANAAVGTVNDYNLLSAAIARAELAPTIITIATPFPDFTLFAPTDAAFQSFLATLPNSGTPVTSEATARDFINTLSPTALADILKYHVVSGRVVSTDLSNGQVVTTALAGGTFTVNIAGSTITLADKNTGIADPTVTSANNLTNAGVLHQINGVLRSN